MKTLKYISIIILALAFTACEKVIEVELDPALKQYVIEGNITNQPGPYTIRVSESTDFFDPGDYPMITDATVVISDSEGTIDTLVQVSDGMYQTSTIEGVPGRSYSLEVTIGNEVFTGSSTMPLETKLDSMTYGEPAFSGFGGGDDYVGIECHFHDPEEYENYYRFKIFINGEPEDEIYLTDDLVWNGLDVEYSRIRLDKNIGDTIKIQFWNIDKTTHSYLEMLSDLNGGGMGSSTPANPESNLSGNVLGYFAAVAMDSLSVVVEE